MRAHALDGNSMRFAFDGVGDLKSADEMYMGEMTLVLVDESTIEQHWKSLRDGQVDHEQVFSLSRVD